MSEMHIETYKCCNPIVNAELAWLAYIVLPNGDYWGVRFNGVTEEIAKAKAIATWQHEQEKWKALEPLADDPWQTTADKQHHLAGLVWMIHKDTREKKRVKLTEITMYEKQGFERGGPRSK